jgi:hypothetical protein
MKTALSILMFVIFAQIAGAQNTLQLYYERCQTKNVEVISGDTIPAEYVIVGSWNIVRTKELVALENISKRELKAMKRFAKQRKSCLLFVDFSSEIIPHYTTGMKSTKDMVVDVYALVKAFPISEVKKMSAVID